MNNSSTTGVVLGRFSPLHKGHEMLINATIDRHGLAQTLVLVGSANSNADGRTPYTFHTRKKMLMQLFPGISVLPLPDIARHEHEFQQTNKQWLDQISALERELQTQFVFYGGSEKDLIYLSEGFPAHVIVDRSLNKITATDARNHITDANAVALEQIMSAAIIPPAMRHLGEV